jgi:hypothetical protein
LALGFAFAAGALGAAGAPEAVWGVADHLARINGIHGDAPTVGLDDRVPARNRGRG